MIVQYDSLAALITAYKASGAYGAKGHGGMSGDEWYGGESATQSIDRTLHGDMTLVPEAERLLDRLDAEVDIPRPQWRPAVCGPYVNIPRLLNGEPAAFMRMQDEADDRSPVNILASVTCSAGIKAATLRKRGVVILALTMALARTRPVNLWTLNLSDGHRDNSGETLITARLQTSPLDLATACYALTSAGFVRRINYDLATAINDFRGLWPRAYSYGSGGQNRYMSELPARLGFDPKRTLVINPAELHDPLQTNPVAWIQSNIDRFRTADDETEELV